MDTSSNPNIDLDNPEFQDIWKLISFTRQSVFMTGKAGTGKSTFLRYIVENTKKRCVVLAPTGIAAVNAGGVTLHSFFHIPLKPLRPDDPDLAVNRIRQRLKHSGRQQKMIRELELIIIDEISMVRADILDFIDKVLRVYSHNMREPFGGKQMLFVGDVFQLEPVVTGDIRSALRDLYPNHYFFSAHVFRQFALIPIELRKVYRQSDSGFIAMLDRLRIGRPASDDLEILNRCVDPDALKASGKDFVMTLASRRDMVDAINDEHLGRLRRKRVIYRGEIRDVFPENALPAPMELTLKVGAQVVFVKNDFEKRWVNGTIGKVHSASDDTLEIELEDGSRHIVLRELWENIEYIYDEKSHRIVEKVLGTFSQYPLKLAWALTIHKSQGLTFSKVIIDMGHGAFTGGQGYVALSRCRSLKGLSLASALRPGDFFVSNAVSQFSAQFNNPNLFAQAMAQARTDDYFHRSAEAFGKGSFSDAVDCFVKAIAVRNELQSPATQRLIAQKLYHLGSSGKRITELEEQLECCRLKFEKLAEEYITMGLDCLSDENYLPAIANFDKAISLSPDMANPYLLKGAALVDCGEDVAAEECFKLLLQKEPLNFEALFALGKVYCDRGDDYEALDRLLAAETVNPDSAPLHDRLAILYSNIGDSREASRHRAIAAKIRRAK